MSFRTLQFAIFGLPLETKVQASSHVVSEELSTYTWWRAVRAKEKKIVVRQKRQRFSSRVLHLPILSAFRLAYYGTLEAEGEICRVFGKFELATTGRAVLWLEFIALVSWQVLAIVRVVKHGIASERTVDLVGFLLFAVGPTALLVLFFVVLIAITRIAIKDLSTLSDWLEDVKAKVEGEYTRPYQDRSGTV